MEISVSENAKLTTNKCKSGFSCFDSDKKDFCEVESCMDWKFHFVKYSVDKDCFYRQALGSDIYCTCPTR